MDRRLGEFLEEAESTFELASSGYLDMGTARKLIEDRALEVANWREKQATSRGDEAGTAALKNVSARLNSFRAHAETRSFPGVGVLETQVYREVFGILTEVLSRPELAKRMIEAILDRMQERRSSKAV